MAGHPKTRQDLTPTLPQLIAPRVLTAIAIAKLRPKSVRYEVRDGGCRGLRVVIQATGHKSFHLRYWHRGAGHNLTLGDVLEGAPESDTAPVIGAPLSLADARLLAVQVLREVKSGRDPGALKRPPSDDAVAGVAADYMKRAGNKLRTASQRSYDLNLISEAIGSRPIVDVRLSDLARLRDRIEEDHGPVAANRALATWSALAEWHASRSDDFRPPSIRRLRIKPRARERVLTDAELRSIWRAANAMGAPFGACVQFLLLSACRRNEAAHLKRGELIDPTTWVIPASRAKTGKDVVIPLSHAAQGIIASVPIIMPGEFVFTTDGRRPIGAFTHFKRRIDEASDITGWRLHDLRRTARTLLSRAGVSADTAERCLGHAIGGVRATYDRHKYLEEMRTAFEALAAQIEAIVQGPGKP